MLFPCFFEQLVYLPVSFQNDTMRVIYMYHNKEPHGAFYTPGSLPDPAEAFKQARSLFLTQRINQAPLKPDPRLRTMELLNQDVNLPQGDGTLHWCKMFKLNDINRKHHLIRVSFFPFWMCVCVCVWEGGEKFCPKIECGLTNRQHSELPILFIFLVF